MMKSHKSIVALNRLRLNFKLTQVRPPAAHTLIYEHCLFVRGWNFPISQVSEASNICHNLLKLARQ